MGCVARQLRHRLGPSLGHLHHPTRAVWNALHGAYADRMLMLMWGLYSGVMSDPYMTQPSIHYSMTHPSIHDSSIHPCLTHPRLQVLRHRQKGPLLLLQRQRRPAGRPPVRRHQAPAARDHHRRRQRQGRDGAPREVRTGGLCILEGSVRKHYFHTSVVLFVSGASRSRGSGSAMPLSRPSRRTACRQTAAATGPSPGSARCTSPAPSTWSYRAAFLSGSTATP